MCGPVVTHLAVPQEAGGRIHVGNRAAAIPHRDTIYRNLRLARRNFVIGDPTLAGVES